MATYFLSIPAVPVPKARPRATVIGGSARIYTPKTTVHFEGLVAEAAERQLPGTPIEGPVSIEIVLFMPRPGRLMRKKDSKMAIPHDRRPDVDNLAKSVLDGLKRHWRDDAQVYSLHAVKMYCPKDANPRVDVTIEATDEQTRHLLMEAALHRSAATIAAGLTPVAVEPEPEMDETRKEAP